MRAVLLLALLAVCTGEYLFTSKLIRVQNPALEDDRGLLTVTLDQARKEVAMAVYPPMDASFGGSVTFCVRGTADCTVLPMGMAEGGTYMYRGYPNGNGEYDAVFTQSTTNDYEARLTLSGESLLLNVDSFGAAPDFAAVFKDDDGVEQGHAFLSLHATTANHDLTLYHRLDRMVTMQLLVGRVGEVDRALPLSTNTAQDVDVTWVGLAQTVTVDWTEQLNGATGRDNLALENLFVKLTYVEGKAQRKRNLYAQLQAFAVPAVPSFPDGELRAVARPHSRGSMDADITVGVVLDDDDSLDSYKDVELWIDFPEGYRLGPDMELLKLTGLQHADRSAVTPTASVRSGFPHRVELKVEAPDATGTVQQVPLQGVTELRVSLSRIDLPKNCADAPIRVRAMRCPVVNLPTNSLARMCDVKPLFDKKGYAAEANPTDCSICNGCEFTGLTANGQRVYTCDVAGKRFTRLDIDEGLGCGANSREGLMAAAGSLYVM